MECREDEIELLDMALNAPGLDIARLILDHGDLIDSAKVAYFLCTKRKIGFTGVTGEEVCKSFVNNLENLTREEKK